MIRIRFSTDDIFQLRQASKEHPHPLVRQKAMALVMKSQNLSHHQIAASLDICENTLRSYLTSYQNGGFDRIAEIHFKGSKGSLASFDPVIRQYLMDKPPIEKWAVSQQRLTLPLKKSLRQLNWSLDSRKQRMAFAMFTSSMRRTLFWAQTIQCVGCFKCHYQTTCYD